MILMLRAQNPSTGSFMLRRRKILIKVTLSQGGIFSILVDLRFSNLKALI